MSADRALDPELAAAYEAGRSKGRREATSWIAGWLNANGWCHPAELVKQGHHLSWGFAQELEARVRRKITEPRLRLKLLERINSFVASEEPKGRG